jgi:hypothetical protein
MSVREAQRRVGGGLFVMGVGQYCHESFAQKLQQIVGTVAGGCEWGYIAAGIVLIGVALAFVGVHYWITAAVEQMCEPS